MYETFFLG